jgi:hypothetical protein
MWLTPRRGCYRAEAESTDFVHIDLKNGSYPAHVWLYIFCGLLDFMWQTAVYWMVVCHLLHSSITSRTPAIPN